MADRPAPPIPFLPDVRRVITGHDSEGKAIVIKDEVVEPTFWSPQGVNAVHEFYRTEETPAVIDSEVTGEWVDHIASKRALVSPNGSTFRSIDLAPGEVVPMHRTGSIDYAIVVKGSVVLVLDDGERRVLKEGDVVVQRGTNHSWINETDDWSRTYFVVIDAQPIKVKGEELLVVNIDPQNPLKVDSAK
ncbi:hypothetical protein QCA50_005425 [Cerrena zonata]|uniref:Cupin type-2 domain-containing protein n=1 Tax=Cerrena zonata TaxID=2478898 RepID=A0AAW0GRZ3_9APHY